MTAPTPANDLAALLAERDRVEAWLQALEGKRESTPQAVFQKVQRDYATRLETLTAQLRERDRELELRVAKLADELTAVEVHQRAKQDMRAEAELRHMVGEYTEEQWAAVAKESDAELAGIEARRVECARDHEAALALLASVRRPVATPAGATPRLSTPAAAPVAPRASAQVPRAGTPAAGTPAQRATPAAGSVAQPPRVTPAAASLAQPSRATPAAGAPSAPPAPPRAATPAAGTPAVPHKATPVEPANAVSSPERGEHIKTPSLDELAFLSSLAADVARRSGMSKAVSESQVSPPPAAPAPAPPARPSRPVTAAEAKAAEAPRRASRPVTAAEAAAPAAPAAPPAPPAPEPRRTAPPSPAQEHLDAGMPPEHAALTDADVNVPRGSHTFATPATEQRAAAAPRVTSRDSASILRRAQAEHVKSLKCAECGTLNLPTEWYCEKCGAELSTL